MNKTEAVSIVDKLLKNARGKLCSRYVLGLERAKESLIAESPEAALKEQEEWAKARAESRHKKKAKK